MVQLNSHKSIFVLLTLWLKQKMQGNIWTISFASDLDLSRFRAEDPGTHYWHAHAGLHKGDGMFGAIVVRQPPSLDPHYALYDHDLSEHVIIVHDWMDMMSLPKYLGHHHDGRLTTPSMMLINGWNGYLFRLTKCFKVQMISCSKLVRFCEVYIHMKKTPKSRLNLYS